MLIIFLSQEFVAGFSDSKPFYASDNQMLASFMKIMQSFILMQNT